MAEIKTPQGTVVGLIVEPEEPKDEPKEAAQPEKVTKRGRKG